nr:capsid protein [Rodent astrovirus]
MARPKSARRNAKTTVTTTTTRGPSKRPGRRTVVRRNRKGNRTSTTTTIVSTRPSNTGARGLRPRPKRPRRDAPNTITTTVTATLGTVGANQGKQVETELVMLMNPALTKETTGSNQFGPIQMYASTYAQWQVTRVHLKATPLVGASAVSGTVVRLSLNMTGAPTSSSWSALGARVHVDVTPGRTAVLKLNKRHFPGPKEGWYNCNTKGDPNMSIGGSIECHTLGKTMSTYQANQFTGDLFLLEMTAVWRFRNYAPQPGLLNMVRGEDTVTENLTVKAEADQPIELQIPATSRVARATGSASSEVIWQLVDTAINTITDNFPPPFNWLFKGGWFFIKRVANAPVASGNGPVATYRVYASIQDARADVPCIATQAANVSLQNQTLSFQQVTPGNVGMGEELQVTSRVAAATDPLFFSGYLQNVFNKGSDKTQVNFPASNYYTGQMNSETYNGRQCWWPFNGVGITPDSRSVDAAATTVDFWKVIGDFYQSGEVANLNDLSYGIPFYYFSKSGGAVNKEQVGVAVAINQLTTPNGAHVTNILWVCTQTKTLTLQPSGGQNGQNPEVLTWHWDRQLTNSNTSQGSGENIKTTATGPWGALRFRRLHYQWSPSSVDITAGNTYVAAFSSWNGQRQLKLSDIWYVNVNNGNISTKLPDDEYWQQNLDQIPKNSGLDASGATFIFHPFTSAAVEPITSRLALDGTLQALRDLTLDDWDPEDDESEPELLVSEDTGLDTETDDDSEPDCDKPDAGERRYPPTPEPGPSGYSNPPPLVLEKLTKKGRELYHQLSENGVPGDVCRKAAQESAPHPAYVAWRSAYNDALVDGLSPRTARSLAWKEACDAMGSRGHAE